MQIQYGAIPTALKIQMDRNLLDKEKQNYGRGKVFS